MCRTCCFLNHSGLAQANGVLPYLVMWQSFFLQLYGLEKEEGDKNEMFELPSLLTPLPPYPTLPNLRMGMRIPFSKLLPETSTSVGLMVGPVLTPVPLR